MQGKVPRIPPIGNRFWGITAILASGLGLWYLTWRVTATLNHTDPIGFTISVILFVAEVYGFVAFLLFYLQCHRGRNRQAPLPAFYPSVDIFITITNESTDVLYRTLVCCRAVTYPEAQKKIYVLDDGSRSEVRALTEKLGCHYLSRPKREFAKAGNLNYGLSHSRGEILAIFDCDHIPVRSFLTETVGFFNDPKVAIVQTPHFFYNPDTFQRNLRLEEELGNEQDLFFRVVEPGRDYYNAAFFAGSSGLFRRSALEEIGGIQTLALTEDLHTSMVLHAKGYRSVYVTKILSAGLAPESFDGYLRQRKRWTRGGIQVFVLDNPLLKPGLSLAQRLQYFSALYYFFHGIPRLIYLSAPLAYLLFGYAPLVADIGTLLVHYVPYYSASLWAFHQVAGKTRNSFWSDVYETAMSFSISVTALATLVSPWRTDFQVTPKGLQKEVGFFQMRLVLPHLTLIGLILFGIVYGLYNFITGETDQGKSPLAISLFWGLYNLALLLAAVAVARERRQVRQAPRLSRMVPVEIRSAMGNLSDADQQQILGVTRNVSETGISIMTRESHHLPFLVQARLLGDHGEVLDIPGMVMRNDQLPTGEGSIGIQFTKVSDEARSGLIRLMFSSPETWAHPPVPKADAHTSFILLLLASFRTLLQDKAFHRFSPRKSLQLPCEIVRRGYADSAVVEDISCTGARLRMLNGDPHGIASTERPGDVHLRIYRTDRPVMSLPGRVMWQRKTPDGVRLGVSFLEVHADIQSFFQ